MITFNVSINNKAQDIKSNKTINNIQKSKDIDQNKIEDVASSIERCKNKKETKMEMVPPLEKPKLSNDKNENAKKKKIRQFLIFILIGLFLVLLTIFVFLFIIKKKQKKDYQKKVELSQLALNPAFKSGCLIARDNVGCTSCKIDYYLMNHQCVKKPINCLIAMDNVGCTSCKVGYYLFQGKCKQK